MFWKKMKTFIGMKRGRYEKKLVYISHVLFPWETFQAQGERETRELANDGTRWTEEFKAEVRSNILRYAEMEDLVLRNSGLNDVYKHTPFHFRDELFSGVLFPVWD